MEDDIRLNHFFNLNSYRQSSEYQDFARAVGLPIPAGEQPSMIGKRWEITEEIYDEFLNMMPPMGWRGDAFYMCEFTFENITAKFTKEGDRYFCEHARYPERMRAPAP